MAHYVAEPSLLARSASAQAPPAPLRTRAGDLRGGFNDASAPKRWNYSSFRTASCLQRSTTPTPGATRHGIAPASSADPPNIG